MGRERKHETWRRKEKTRERRHILEVVDVTSVVTNAVLVVDEPSGAVVTTIEELVVGTADAADREGEDETGSTQSAGRCQRAGQAKGGTRCW